MKRKRIELAPFEQGNKETTFSGYGATYGEYAINWRNIIFLPFNELWQFLILCSVVLLSLVIVYEAAYDKLFTTEEVASNMYYIFSALYLFDTILSISHRCMVKHRSTREYEPKPMIYILSDIISLLPIYEFYVMLKIASRVKVQARAMKTYLHLNCVLRIYRVHIFFATVSNSVTVNKIMIVFIQHYLRILMLSHFSGVFLYLLSLWNSGKPNWTINLRRMKFDKENPLHWLTICYTTVGCVVAHNWRGNIRGETPMEEVLFNVSMLFGFIIHYMIFFGKLINAYIRSTRRQFLFVDNLTRIRNFLAQSEMDKSLQTKTTEYYKTYWERRSGIKNMPVSFNLLPVPLQKEVAMDIFWEALKHTHLFGTEEIPFKRALSLQMKNEFYLPGDYVFRLNQLKAKMVYIVSGILQILTAEDEDSPIISFSSGAVLGELTCIMPSKSIANLRCATYCELQTLNLDSLFKTLKNYPEKTKNIRTRLNNRITKGKEVMEFRKTGQSVQPVADGLSREDYNSSIKWIKYRWRELTKLHHHSKKLEVVEIKIDPNHTSEYLDLYVFSEKVELKMQVICLRGSCPFLMEPGSSFRRCVNGLVVITVILQCIILPYLIAFKRSIPRSPYIVCCILDFIYYLDIYMQLSTAISKHYVFISNSSVIIMERLKEVNFLIDILASLPADYMFALFNISPYAYALLKLNRLLKMNSVIQHFKTLEKNIWFSSLNVRLIKYALIYFISGYWSSCLVFAMICYRESCNSAGQFKYNATLQKGAPFGFYDHPAAGVESIYYALTTFLNFGISRSYQYTPFGLITHHILVMAGYFLVSFCFAELCAIFVLRLERTRSYNDYVSMVTNFVNINNVCAELKTRMMILVRFWWDYNHNVDILGKGGLLEEASEELKDKIVKQRIKACLAKVPLFHDCDDKILNMIAQACELKVLPSEFEVIKADRTYGWLHIVLRGFCKMKSIMPGDFERNVEITLCAADAFPLVETLHQVQSFVSVKTITDVELICIKYTDLMDMFITNPSTGKYVLTTLKEHFQENERILLRKRGRLPEMIPDEHSLGRGEMFTYKIYDNDITDPEKEAYLKPFKNLGIWHFLRYFLFRKTINPQGSLFISWEIGRCVFATMRAFLGLTYFSLFANYRSQLNYLLRFLEFTSFLDCYIRLHCQYYNKSGIIVTHPWSTAKHYCKTSFLLDLFATLPFRQLQIDQLLGLKYREKLYIFLAAVSRPWQLYRLVGFINYFQIVHNTTNVLQAVKYTVLFSITIVFMATIIQVHSCDISVADEKGKIDVHCGEDAWIHHSSVKEKLTPINVYVQCVYVAITIFTSSTSGVYSAYRMSDGTLFLALCVVAFVIKWLMFAKLTSHRIGGNANLTIYRERIKSFVDFMKSEYVDDELTHETMEHFRYSWNKTHGSNITNTLGKFPIDLHKDIIYNLYGSTLEKVVILKGADFSFFRHLGIHLQEKHFKKDSEVIRCNDVQGLLFIVHKGRIDITIAKQRICTLGKGGIFGCLEKQGITRQTITAIAKVHVQLLVINSNLFHQLIDKYKQLKDHIAPLNVLHYEYVESKDRTIETEPDYTSQSRFSSASLLKNLFEKTVSRSVIKINTKWFEIFNYIVCVHISTLCSISVMFYALMTGEHGGTNFVYRIPFYLIDLIYILKIYFAFHLAYVDVESGIVIEDLPLIRKKYLKSFTCWIDIFTCFPFDFIVYFVTNNPLINKYSLLNRALRIIFLLRYYSYSLKTLHVKTHLRWTYLFYCISFNLQLMTCLWWLTACFEGTCYYLESTDEQRPKVYKKARPGLASLTLAYTYILNLFTLTGFEDVAPMTTHQVFISIIILTGLLFITIGIASEFATLLDIQQFTLTNYEYDINRLRTYVEGRDLSPSITEKTWKYTIQLWQRQRGEWMPAIIKEAPAYIKQELMHAMYGIHLQNHFLFANTHIDFLRQLVVHLKRCVFFPGNYLVEQGDIDDSMYFIHDGEVEVYESHGNNYMLRIILKRNESFGEESGMFKKPHKYSYKARTTVDAIILTRSDWKYLLKWFPASHEEILKKAVEQGLNI